MRSPLWFSWPEYGEASCWVRGVFYGRDWTSNLRVGVAGRGGRVRLSGRGESASLLVTGEGALSSRSSGRFFGLALDDRPSLKSAAPLERSRGRGSSSTSGSASSLPSSDPYCESKSQNWSLDAIVTVAFAARQIAEVEKRCGSKRLRC
jgi:hypothetical protein